MLTERVLLFIKPRPIGIPPRVYGAVELERQTIDIMKMAGIEVVERFMARITPAVIEAVYPNLPLPILCATRAELEDQIVPVIVMTGEHAQQMARITIGHSTSPKMCLPGTIRHEWWKRTHGHEFGLGEIRLPGGAHYWSNFVHRSLTAKEFLEQYAALNATRT